MPEARTDQGSRQYETVARAIAFIRAKALDQPSLADIAAAVGLSQFHLQRVFSQWAGLSPKRFLQYVTKEHAVKALRESGDVLGAAMQTGLSGPGRLHDLMVSCEAMTPGEIKAQGEGLGIGYGFAATPFGQALIGWTGRGVCFLAFRDGDQEAGVLELAGQWPKAGLQRDDAGAESLAGRIFPATPRPGGLHLVLRGTNFQVKVWEALLRTEPSQVLSYRRLAALAGFPKAPRAVGSALAANVLGYLIPCHRVIRESGEIGNYRWGAERKLAMLAWEAGRVGQDSAGDAARSG